MEPPAELPEKFAPMGLTYDDVLLLPGYSEIAPSDADPALADAEMPPTRPKSRGLLPGRRS